MPFKPKESATPEDYPELITPRIPWEEWGAQEQEETMLKALGADLCEWLERGSHDTLPT